MLTPADFVARWGQGTVPLIRFPSAWMEPLALSADDKAFLVQAGLPEDAAPFLSFQVRGTGQLATLSDVYRQPDSFRRYRLIGSDSVGNPIALDEGSSGEVVVLDHENRFARVPMNSSVRQLAESLLAYRTLVASTQAEFGPDAFLDGKTSAASRAELRESLKTIDGAAMRPGCFWYGEVQALEANAG